MELRCEECGRLSREGERGWEAHRTDDPADQDEEPGCAFYCRECAAREFRGDP